MKRYKRVVARGALAVAALIGIAGAGALSFAEGASAATPTITVTPNSGLQAQGTTTVTVSGSGFAASSAGAILECNNTSPQPTVDVEPGARVDRSTGVVRAGPRSQHSLHDERNRYGRRNLVHGDDRHGRPSGHRNRLNWRRRCDRCGQVPLPAHGSTASGRGFVSSSPWLMQPATRRQRTSHSPALHHSREPRWV